MIDDLKMDKESLDKIIGDDSLLIDLLSNSCNINPNNII